ncbi:protein kinase [Stieleria sp. ICT_E10.1]|uniref:protein kinase domain-containing protein n=1 Tax=Stieleria sedimenti TaxID=2976331 RepID=UPI00217FFD5B|nr:protein kinase [Stieleria sedimenti]MCS7467240.1 protein kinase [Stieleria sedimenti]
MGVVFKARQEKLRRTVALKMILTGPFASAAEVERFQREARAAAALKHPNIVGVHEIGIHDGHHYFTMDFVDSESLSGRLQRGSLSDHEAAGMLKQVATATHYAHQNGVLHRDLKPSNLLIDHSGQPHVTDFGLAKPLGGRNEDTIEEITCSGQILGTPSYMSPEQAQAKHQLVGVASDIYSLGAILYACLCGRAPFVAESSIETLRQVIHDEPIPLRVFNQRVPKDLENICLKCLAKEPHRRYGTAEALADDLQRYLQGRPVLARPISRFAKTYRWAKRNPWIAATATLFVLVALSGPIVAFRESALRFTSENNLKFAEEETRRANANADAERDARKIADRAAARSKYFLAMAHWDAGRTRKALRTLEEVPKNQRTMEWNLAYREFLSSAVTFYGHTGEVFCVDVSPNDNWIASASDGELRIWNLSSGEQHRLIKTDGRVTSLKFLDDSRRLLASIGNQICVWDTSDGRKLRTLEEIGPFNQIQCFAISPDESVLVTGTGRREEPGQVSFWDFETGNRTKRVEIHNSSGVFRIDLSPDKQLFATVGYNHRFSIRHFESGEEAWPGSSGYSDVEFHPSGYSVALLSFSGDINVMKSAKGSILNIYPGPESGRGSQTIEWNPTGTFLAIGTVDGRIERVSPSTRFLDQQLGHLGAVNDIAFCSDKARFVSVGADRSVRVWGGETVSPTLAVENKFPVGRVPNLYDCINVAWSPDGTRLASGSVSNQITIWDAATLETLHTVGMHPDLINDIAFFPDGEKVASACADKLLRVWKLDQGEELLTLSGHRGFISEVEVSPDGKWMVSGDQNSEVRLWNAETGQLIRSWFGASRQEGWVRFSPNETWIAYVADGGTVEVREIVSGELVRTIQPAVYPSCISFAEKSSTLWVGGGSYYTNGIEAWNIDTGKQVFRKSLGSNELITSLSFSPAHDRLLTADFIGTVKLWDTDSWEELRQFRGNRRRTIVRFSPADLSCVCGSYSHSGYGDFADPYGTVRVWDASDRFEVAEVYSGFENEVQTAGFSKDGSKIVGVSKAGKKGTWDRQSGERLTEDSIAEEEPLNHRFGDLIAIPFDDRVRIFDLAFRRQSRFSQIQKLSRKAVERSNRMAVNGAYRGPSVALFEMGWLIERGMLSESEKTRLLHWLARKAIALKSAYAKRYPEEANVDLNLLLPRDVRRAIKEYSLDDPKWLEEPEADETDALPDHQSALVVALDIQKKIEQATNLQNQKKFDEARGLCREVLAIMQAQTDDPFETLARIGSRKNPFTMNDLFNRLASLEQAARRPKARIDVLEQLVDLIRRGMRPDVALDWRYLGQIQFELEDFKQSGEALNRYLSMTDKSELIPEVGELSAFLNADDFHLVYRVMRTRGLRPAIIDGELKEGVPVYRARFKPIDCRFYNYYGIEKRTFTELSNRFAKQGFALVHEDRFDNAGRETYSAVWEQPWGDLRP